MARIKDKHLHIARSGHCLNPDLRETLDMYAHLGDTPGQSVVRYYEHLAEKNRIHVSHKSSSDLQLSKMTTTYYREIRLGSGWDKKHDNAKAITWAHEWVHVEQWRMYGRARFASRYLVSPGYSWAYEMQAYRESLRMMALLGFSPATREMWVDDRFDRIRKAYPIIARLEARQMYKLTVKVLSAELEYAV